MDYGVAPIGLWQILLFKSLAELLLEKRVGSYNFLYRFMGSQHRHLEVFTTVILFALGDGVDDVEFVFATALKPLTTLRCFW